LAAEVELVVADGDTAQEMQTGDVPVLSTPRLVALAEEASVRAIEGKLPEGHTSVGQQVQLDHLAPSGVGDTVLAQATLEHHRGRRLTFTVSVNDKRGLVAVGRVTRVLVDRNHFLDKVYG
jgi:fluoroacetyl-CoA thioesterase